MTRTWADEHRTPGGHAANGDEPGPGPRLCLLYRKTGTRRYLDMALQIVDEFAAQGEDGPLAGDYLRQALAGPEFYRDAQAAVGEPAPDHGAGRAVLDRRAMQQLPAGV